jgi:DNA-binding NtrC family response regulator
VAEIAASDVRLLCVGDLPELFGEIDGLLAPLRAVETRCCASSCTLASTLENFQASMIISPLHGPDIAWREVLAAARGAAVAAPVVFVGPSALLDEAIAAVREGAQDFIPLPADRRSLLLRLENALQRRRLQEQLSTVQRELRFRRNADYIVGGSLSLQSVLAQIMRVAESDISVLITGESGTGKELVARAIHYNGRRAGRPFVAINCAGFSEALLENELFGHLRGSYTGADSTTRGLYEEADGGTLFLDEVGELGAALQTKLLRVLEHGEFRRVGSTESGKADVRVIAATNKDLDKAVRSGTFRGDLYYRLNVFPIHVPPLRERKEDIPQLVGHFVTVYQAELNRKVEGFSPSAIQKLMFYHWPGNVRELENKVRQAMINAAGPRIFREDIELDDTETARGFKSFRDAKREFERNYVINVLRITNGNVAEAARLARKDRKDFYDQMAKYNIKAQDFRIS